MKHTNGTAVFFVNVAGTFCEHYYGASFTCEANLLAANGASVLFLFVLAGILVVGVRIRRGSARTATCACSALFFQFLKFI